MNITERKALAEDLAKGLLEAIDGPAFHVPHYMARQAAAELRRLAQVEAEHAALLKAISDAEPVAHLWQHGETGRTRIVMPDQIVTADANWLVVGPLYTINGIKP